MFIKQISIYLSTVHGGQKSTLQQRLQHLQPGALLRQLLLQIDRTHGAHIVGFHLLRNSTMVLGQKPPGLRCQKHPMGVIKGYSNGLQAYWLVVDLPLWKIILVSWDYYSKYYGQNKTCSKPPTRKWPELFFHGSKQDTSGGDQSTETEKLLRWVYVYRSLQWF